MEECLAWQPDISSGDIAYRMPGVLHTREDQCKAEFSEKYIPCYDPLNPPGATLDEKYTAFKVF